MDFHSNKMKKMKAILERRQGAIVCSVSVVLMTIALCIGVLATTGDNLQADRTDFDKNTEQENYEDVRVAYQLEDKWLLEVNLLTSEVNMDGTAVLQGLEENTDYVLESGSVVLKKEYLSTLEDGQKTFLFTASEILVEGAVYETGETGDTEQVREPEIKEEKLVINVMTTEETEATELNTESVETDNVDTEALVASEGENLNGEEDTEIAVGQEEGILATPNTAERSSAQTRAGSDYSVSMKWGNITVTDESQLIDMVWSGTASTMQTFTASLTINTNVEEYATGDMEIRIPYTIMYDRNGRAVVPYSYGIPLSPNVSGSDAVPFNYYIDTATNEIVIKNYRTVASSSNFTIQFTYRVYPIAIVDMSKGILQAKVTAKNTSGVTETETSNDISLTIDTSISLGNLAKTQTELMYYWNPSYVSGEKPADFDDYCYVVYKIATAVSGNQPRMLVWSENPNCQGEMVSVTGDGVDSIDYENGIIRRVVTSTSSTATSITNSLSYTVVIRYPREQIEAAGNQVLNEVTVEVTPIDGIDDPIVATASRATTWADYSFSYRGSLAATSKTANGSGNSYTMTKGLTLLENGRDVTLATWGGITYGYGYNYDSYSLEWIDDFMDWKTDSGTNVQMGPNDYEHKSVSVSVTHYDIDRSSGQRIYAEKSTPDAGEVNVWALIEGAADYQLIDTYYVSDLCWAVGATSYSRSTKIVALPEGTYRVKVAVNDSSDYVEMNTSLTTVVKGDSPTLLQWLEEDIDISSIQIRNFSAVKFYDQNGQWVNPASETNYSDRTSEYGRSVIQRDLDTYGNYIVRGTNDQILTGLVGAASSGKVAATAANDTVKRQATMMFGLYAYDYYSGLTTSDIAELQSLGIELSREEMTFYDLLPLGMYYDEGYEAQGFDIKGNNSNVKVEVDTVDDYKGTGRQMVIIKAYTITEGENYCTSGYAYYPTPSGVNINNTNTGNRFSAAGFQVRFRAVVKWEDVAAANGGTNLMVAMVPEPYKGSTGYFDTGTYNSNFTSVTDEEGKPVFYDVDGDGDVTARNIRPGDRSVSINVDVSMEEGLSKNVKALETPAAVGYQKEDLALIGSTYTYRLMLQNTDGGYMSEVILFDILETAAQDGEESWKGTFKSINTIYATISGIRPTIYYTTVTGLTYADINAPGSNYNTLHTMLESSADWSTSVPEDKSTITAVAIDLSKALNGSNYVFEPSSGTSILITMDAPEELRDEVYAYNSSAFYSTFAPLVGGMPESSFLTGTRTTVELGSEPLFIKSSDPEGGETQEDAVLITAGEIVTYTITYNPGCATEDIVMKDVIPDGMSLVAGSITYKMLNGTTENASDTCYNPVTRTITWPTYSQSRAGEAVFSFQVLVEGSADTYVYYANQATANIGSNEEETSNTVTHEQIVPFADIGKTAALVDNINFEEDDLASDGDVLGENSGNAVEPVETALGQIVEYHLVVTNTGGTGGRYIITDQVPEGTTLVSGSITGIFREGGSDEESSEEEEETYVSEGTVTYSETDGVITWVLENMADGEEAYLTFRIIAPEGTDILETEIYETDFMFTNTAHLKDVHLSEIKYESEVTVYTEDGAVITYEAGANVYEEEAYEKDSETTYHQLHEELCSLTITKKLTEASDEEQKFVFEISYTRVTGTTITFYQIVTVPAGETTALVTVIDLAPGEYTITELESNWRYSIDSSDTAVKSIVLEDPEGSYGVSFTNTKTSEIWVGGKGSLTNTMPRLTIMN